MDSSVVAWSCFQWRAGLCCHCRRWLEVQAWEYYPVTLVRMHRSAHRIWKKKNKSFFNRNQLGFFFSAIVSLHVKWGLKPEHRAWALNLMNFILQCKENFPIIFHAASKQCSNINPPFVQKSLNHVQWSSWILYIRHKVDWGVRSIGSSQVSSLKSCYNDGLSLSQTWLKNIKRCTATHYIQNLKTVRKQLKKDEAYNQAICLKNI